MCRSAAFGIIVMALAISCGALSARSTVRTIEVLDVLALLLIVAIPDIGILYTRDRHASFTNDIWD